MTNEMKSTQPMTEDVQTPRWELIIDGRLQPETFATEDEASQAGANQRLAIDQKIEVRPRGGIPVVPAPAAPIPIAIVK